jgi:gliding motility-associated-like protein/uncharacterized repeat protein (TIGR01451 family)
MLIYRIMEKKTIHHYQILKKILFLLFAVYPFTHLQGQNCSVNAGVPFEVCANGTLTLSGGKTGLFEGAGTTTWSQIEGPSAVIADPTDLSSSVGSIVGGHVYRFRLSATCQDGAKVSDDVLVTVRAITIANAGQDVVLCPGNGVANLQANSISVGETGAWTIIGTNNGVTVVSANSPTSLINLNPNNAGNTTLRWTVNNSSCSSFDDVVVTNRGGVSPVSAGAAPTVSNCYATTGISGGASASFGGGAGGQGGIWSVINGPNIPTITSPNSRTTTFSNLIEGTYVFQWTVSGECVNGSGQITVLVPAGNGGSTNAGSNQTLSFCDNRTTISLTGPSATRPGETVSWTKISGAAGEIIESPNSPSTIVNNLDPASNYQFRYTITPSNGCPVSSTTRTLTRTIQPGINITTTSPLLLPCGSSSATINYTATGSGNNNWRILSGPTTPSYPSIPTGWSGNVNSPTTITGLTKPGTYQVQFRRVPTAGSGCETVFDEITIVVAQTATASNAGTDQILACDVFNTNLVGNIPTVGSGMWTQVQGPNQATMPDPYLRISPISNLIAGEYIFRWLIFSGNGCESSQDDVSVIVSDPSPTTSAVGEGYETCNSTPVYLQGNNYKRNEKGTWSVLPSAGISFSDIHSPNAVANGLASNTAYKFTWTINNACGTSSSDVFITTTNVVGAIAAYAGDDQCQPAATNFITMDGNDPSPGIGTWTKVSGGNATISNPTLNTTTITDLEDGTYLFEWSITNGTCGITRDTVMVTISTPVAVANPANAGADQNICGTTGQLQGNAPTIGQGLWKQVGGAGGAIIENPSAYNSNISGLQSGAYKFEWRITNNACPPSSDQVQINVSLPPTVAFAGPDQSFCSASPTATMAANSITNGTGIWNIVSGPATPTISTPGSPLSTVSGLTAVGTYILRWKSYNGPYCPESTDDVSIIIAQPANAGTNQNLCDVSSVSLSGNTSTFGTWTQDAGPGIATITPISTNSAIASALVPGTYTFRYTYDVATACSNTATVNVAVSAMPLPADAGPDQTVCDVNSVSMAGNTPSIGTGTWSRVSGPNTPTIVSPNSPTATIGGATALTNGTYFYRWTIVNGSCSTADDMMIQRASSGTSANAGPDQPNVCGSLATMAANPPSPGVGTWSQVSGTPAKITSTILPNTSVTDLLPGNFTFKWSITNGLCSASEDEVDITAYALPTIPNAGSDQSLCGQASTFLSGNIISIGSGLWSQISGPNTAVIVAPNEPGTEISGLVTGTYQFRWTATNGPCSTSDDVTISITTPPTLAQAGDDQNVCLYSAINLTGNTPAIGTGSWSKVSGPNISIVSPNSPTTSVTGVTAGTYIFKWTISNGICPPSEDELTILVNELPTEANAGIDQSLCEPVNAALAANNPTVGSGSWSLSSGPNTPVLANSSQHNSSISNLVPGQYRFKWTIVNGPCSSEDEVTVSVYQNPTISNAGENRGVCGTNTTTLDGNVPTIGIGNWTRVSGPNVPVIVSPSLANTSVNGLVNGTYQFRWTISNGSCAPSVSLVNLQVLTGSVTNANAGADQIGSALCGLNTTTLNANSVTLPETGLWSVRSGTGGSFSSPTQHNTSFTGTPGNSYTLRWTISNGACSAFDDTEVYFPQNPSPANASDQTGTEMCGKTSTILDGNVPTVGTGSWSIVSGTGGWFDDSLSPTTIFNGIPSNTYTLKWTISNNPCAITEKEITITFRSKPAVPAIGDIVHPTCETATGSVVLNNLPASGTWTINPGNITGTGTTYTVLGLTEGTHTFTLTNSENCLSDISSDVVINAQPLTPGISVENVIDPATCNGNGTIGLLLTNVSDGVYQILHSNGIFDNISVVGNRAEIAVVSGTYSNIKILANGCWSVDGIDASLEDPELPNAPLIGTITDPDCDNPRGSVVLENLPALGNWTINPGTIEGSGNSYTVGNLLPGTYNFTITNSANCTSAPSADVIINLQPAIPSLTVSAVNNPTTCGGMGTIELSFTDVPNGMYQISYANGTFANVLVNDNKAVVAAGAGTYNNLLIEANGCISSSVANALITNPELPGIPSISSVIQPNCETATGSIVLANLPSVGTWTINPGNISGTGTSYTIHGLSPGEYRYTVTNSANCISLESGTATISPQPAIPAIAIMSTSKPNVCGGNGSIHLQLTNVDDGTYNLTHDLGVFSNVMVSNNIAIIQAGAGTYRNIRIVSNGCPSAIGVDAIIDHLACADLSILKTVDITDPEPGNLVTFSIVVRNNGPDNATNVVVTDVLPSGYTFVSANPSAGNWLSPNWQVGSLASGGSQTLLISATVNATGNYLNRASVTATETDPDITNNEDTELVNPRFGADLSVSKTVNIQNPIVGTEIVFTLTVTNHGPANATNVVLTDQLPDGYTLNGASAQTGSWNSPNWTIGNLAIGASATLEIRVRVNTSGNYNNTASVTSDQTDPDITNNEDSETTTPRPSADLMVLKTVNQQSAFIGTEVVFTIEAHNLGVSHATGVFVTDILPNGYTYISDNSGGDYNPVTGRWDIGDLNNGDMASIEITAKVMLNGTYTNIATIGGNEFDPDTGNNRSETTVDVNTNLFIPEGISPNKDGKNDLWEIIGLEQFPNHKVMIFNRWGNKVFEASPYLNNWDGTNMFGVTVGGRDLPVGTYFYILEPGDGEKPIKGYIYLSR